MWEVRDGAVTADASSTPPTWASRRRPSPTCKGGDVADNVRVADAVLAGEQGAPRDIVVLGAAAALIAADRAASMGRGAVDAAAEAIDSGRAAGLVTALGRDVAAGCGDPALDALRPRRTRCPTCVRGPRRERLERDHRVGAGDAGTLAIWPRDDVGDLARGA